MSTTAHKKTLHCAGLGLWELPGMDSNHEWLDQNQLCYHYTTGQFESGDNSGVVMTGGHEFIASKSPNFVKSQILARSLGVHNRKSEPL